MLAIGNFDGLHLGHQAVLGQAKAVAEMIGAALGVMSFAPHPRVFFTPDAPALNLMRAGDKLRGLRDRGASAIFLQRFNQAFASLDADAFIQEVLVASIGVRHVVTGEDFAFGRKKSGDAQTLAKAAQADGFSYDALPPVMVEGVPCSSSRIRAHLAAGDPKQAAALLGHPHRISGHVAHGDKRGRTIGFPTANLGMEGVFLPKFGVYAVSAKVMGRTFNGVANLGIRPTVGGDFPRLEVHLFDFDANIYGQRMEVSLQHFLRGEEKFADFNALKLQIARDAEAATAYFKAL